VVKRKTVDWNGHGHHHLTDGFTARMALQEKRKAIYPLETEPTKGKAAAESLPWTQMVRIPMFFSSLQEITKWNNKTHHKNARPYFFG
jgi:hypothetical protein